MTEKLKPCPFCGGEATLVEGLYNDRLFSYVSCDNDNCNAKTGRCDTNDEAITRWNKRSNPWHTGTPTENGDYWVAFRWGLDNEIMHDMASHVLYGATAFVNGNWRIDYPYVVVAWQKIEPYKEKDR